MRTRGLVLHENFDRIYGNGVPIARCKFQAITGRSLKNMADNAKHFVATWNSIEAIGGDPDTVGELVNVLLGCRRSDGHGGYLNCWCDSECGAVPASHTHYCRDANALLAKVTG